MLKISLSDATVEPTGLHMSADTGSLILTILEIEPIPDVMNVFLYNHKLPIFSFESYQMWLRLAGR